MLTETYHTDRNNRDLEKSNMSHLYNIFISYIFIDTFMLYIELSFLYSVFYSGKDYKMWNIKKNKSKQ